MEMHRSNSEEKRRRKVIQKGPVLVRSVKPGQTAIPLWQNKQATTAQLWKK
jgi:hypothetical protein